MTGIRAFILAWVVGWTLLNGLIASSSIAASDDQVTMRSWQHTNGGRLVIEWQAPIRVSQKKEDNRLILRFSRPLNIDPGPALDRLAAYLNVNRSTIKGTDLSLELLPEVSANLEVHKKSIVIIDLSQPESEEPDIKVDLSTLQNGMRLDLGWPGPFRFEESKQNGALSLSFNAQGRIGPTDLSYLNETLRPWFSELRQTRGPAGTTLTFDLEPMIASSVQRRGERSLVIDFTRDASLPSGGKAAVPTPAVRPASSKPTSGTLDASLPPLPKKRPTTLDKPVVEDQTEIIDEPASRQNDIPIDALVFDWLDPVGAAVFKRAGYLWVAFDALPASSNITLPPPSPTGLMEGEMIEADQATVMRFPITLNAGIYVWRDELGRWSIRLEADPALPDSVTISPMEKSHALHAIAASNGRIINVIDPLVGDEISIWPIQDERRGQRQPRRFVDLELLPSAQGLIWRSFNDQLITKPLPDGIEISSQQGLALSIWPEGDIASGDENNHSQEEPAEKSGQSHDLEKSSDIGIASGAAERLDDHSAEPQQASVVPRPSPRPSAVLKQPPGNSSPSSYLDLVGSSVDRSQVGEARRNLRQAISRSAPEQQDQARLDLARLLVAERLASEAKIVLHNISEDADERTDASRRALRGAVAFLTGDLQEAASLLRAPDFDADDEIEIWRAALESLGRNWQIAAESWKASSKNLDVYPPKLRLELGLLALETAIQTDDDKLTRKALRRLNALELKPYEAARVDRMHALKAERDGDVERAKEILKTLANGRYHGLSVLADFQLALLAGADDPHNPDPFATLNERLPLWRGHPHEIEMIDGLARRYRDAKQPKKALGLWQYLSITHPKTEDNPAIKDARQTTYIEALTNPGDQEIRLLEAYAIYLDFINLLPAGEVAQSLHRDLGRHLAGLDLLYEAVLVLQPLLEDIDDAVEKAELGTEIADLLLLQDQPEAALSILNRTSPRQQTLSKMVMEGHQLVRARALARLNRDQEALQQIRGLQSLSARYVRAEIFWKQRNWTRLAPALESLFEDPELNHPLGVDDQKLVLWLALARAQQGQVRQLSDLRRRYASDMASGPWSDDFLVATQTKGRRGDIASVLAQAESQLTELKRFREGARADP